MKPSEDPLPALLLGRVRAAILSVLLTNPRQALHVRELARVTGSSPGSLHRELRMLAQAGLLLREPAGRQVFYRAATEHPCHAALTALVGGHRRVAGSARAAGPRDGRAGRAAARTGGSGPRFSAQRLAAVCRRHHVRRLAMFGSAARGEMTKSSDVDLIIEFEPGRAPSFWDSPGIEDELSAVFDGRRVDLMPPEVLANPFRRDEIMRDLTVLYEADRR